MAKRPECVACGEDIGPDEAATTIQDAAGETYPIHDECIGDDSDG